MNYRKQLDIPVFHLLKEVVAAHGKEAYVVGGYVRDVILNRPVKDIDVVVIGDGIELANAVAKKINVDAPPSAILIPHATDLVVLNPFVEIASV